MKSPLLRCLLPLALAAALPAAAAAPIELAPRLPRSTQETVLVAPAAGEERPYLAFPDVLDLGDDVLVSYKRGRAHANDPGASLDMVRLGGAGGTASRPRTIAEIPERIMQMGEWVRFPNGDIANYIDAQQAPGAERVGLRVVRSRDGGRTFGPVERVGPIEGVEYGYAFDAVSEGRTTWMLVMTFARLAGGKSMHALKPAAGSVDIVRSEDNGRTWRFVRGLNAEFGNIAINESALLRHGAGFLVSTRGYDNRQRIHMTDAEFRVIRQADLTETHAFIASYVGRPRLFARDGGVYLLGRNWTKSATAAVGKPPAGAGPMQLCLFRVDPATLRVTSYSILDNNDQAKVTDGYYAVPYFREAGGRTRMHVVTYKGIDRAPPRIIRLDYDWAEVR